MGEENTYYRAAWEAGRKARADGKGEDANPYKPSGHERDTTFEDECHYQWWSGYHSDPGDTFGS
jgi:hypothetical protein